MSILFCGLKMPLMGLSSFFHTTSVPEIKLTRDTQISLAPQSVPPRLQQSSFLSWNYGWIPSRLSTPLPYFSPSRQMKPEGFVFSFSHQPLDWIQLKMDHSIFKKSIYAFQGSEWIRESEVGSLVDRTSIEAHLKGVCQTHITPFFSVEKNGFFSDTNSRSTPSSFEIKGVRSGTQLTPSTRFTFETSTDRTKIQNSHLVLNENQNTSAGIRHQIIHPVSLFSDCQMGNGMTPDRGSQHEFLAYDYGLEFKWIPGTTMTLGERSQAENSFLLENPIRRSENETFFAAWTQNISRHWKFTGSFDHQIQTSFSPDGGRWEPLDETTRWNMQILPSIQINERFSIQMGYRYSLQESEKIILRDPSEHRASIGIQISY